MERSLNHTALTQKALVRALYALESEGDPSLCYSLIQLAQAECVRLLPPQAPVSPPRRTEWHRSDDF